MNYKGKYPRILVISNNAFSKTSNNGKTLASFFKEVPPDRVAQLYFNAELPSDEYYKNYFRITDKDLATSIFSLQKPGRVIEVSNFRPFNHKSNSMLKKIKKYDFFRIVREAIWIKWKWNNDSLNNWLKSFAPDVIFLCAGDSGFSYEIANYIQKKYKTKLIIYITDDYILPRKTISPFWWIRRSFILNKMKKSIKKSDLFITISEEMRSTYKKIFGVDSILAMNISESMRLEGEIYKVRPITPVTTLVYTGGLHFNRYKTLYLLAKAIEKYNLESDDKRVFLKIYSGNEPGKKVKEYLNIDGASQFCGSLNQEELKEVLNLCEIPVHVESFDSKSIASTKLSISTKIPEYLSLEKPVLAIGPKEVASMKYLEGCGFCITNPDEIYTKLKQLLTNNELKVELSTNASKKYKRNHRREIVLENLYDKIINS